MKKATTLFLLFTISSFAQTKEETIAWITEKLEKHGTFSGSNQKIQIIKVTPCEISYIYSEKDGQYYTEKFNPSSSVWKTIEDDNSKDFAYVKVKAVSGKVIEKYFNNWSNGRDISTGDTKYSGHILIFYKGEPDMGERLAKALNHLATFCEKKKETF